MQQHYSTSRFLF